MNSIKIVFTGGPCAGKTKLIEKTKEYLLSKNYNLIVIPETATKILESGFKFDLIEDIISFQTFIFKKQLFNEKMVNELLELKKDKNFIVLYDRGILDNKAYCKDYKNFDKILSQQNESELDFLDNYNLVFDLITTADCAPEKYTLATNKERTETIEEAKALDRKTSNAWAGHRNLKIINSNISIDEAFELLIKEIDSIIENNSKKEIKKINIENKLEDFNNYNDNNSRLIDIEEIELDKENYTYNLYKRTYKGKTTYIFKVFKIDNEIMTTYYDKKINFQLFLELITKYKIKTIEKYKQLSIIENRQEFIIKFYDDYSILEYEENVLNEELILPKNIKIKNKQKILLKN